MSSIPPPMGTASQDDQLEYLMIQVDRLKTSNKILRWAAATGIILGLGSAGGLASWLYGRGVTDEYVRNGIERCRGDGDLIRTEVEKTAESIRFDFRAADDSIRADVKELQRAVFPRRTAPFREDK